MEKRGLAGVVGNGGRQQGLRTTILQDTVKRKKLLKNVPGKHSKQLNALSSSRCKTVETRSRVSSKQDSHGGIYGETSHLSSPNPRTKKEADTTKED